MKRYRIIIFGNVQGVGFRWYARDIAKISDITGIVKNLYDGTVEIVAEGEEDILESFILELKKGYLGSNIDNIESTEEPSTQKFTDFRIVF